MTTMSLAMDLSPTGLATGQTFEGKFDHALFPLINALDYRSQQKEAMEWKRSS